MAVLTPLNFLFSLWKKLLTLLFHKKSDEGITDEELVAIVSEAENQGGLDREESQLIRSAILFDDLEAGDILTPRVDVVAIKDTASMEEVTAVFAAEGCSRLPVYHETLDNVVGVLHQKDLFSVTGSCDAATVSGWVMEQLGCVPEPGDRFVWESLDVTVTRVEHHRVLEIRVVQLEKDDNTEAQSDFLSVDALSLEEEAVILSPGILALGRSVLIVPCHNKHPLM